MPAAISQRVSFFFILDPLSLGSEITPPLTSALTSTFLIASVRPRNINVLSVIISFDFFTKTMGNSFSFIEFLIDLLLLSNYDKISFSFWKFLINSIKDFLSTIKKYNEKATIIETNIEINLI